MRALTVCVDYLDYASVTVPYNRHHFDEFWIVTDHGCAEDVRKFADRLDCRVVVTDLFYVMNSPFAKYAALEFALDCIGRSGWLALLDADVLWPKDLGTWQAEFGKLYSPLRHMAPTPPPSGEVPPESEWWEFPVHRNIAEWAGYTQVFHAEDPALGPAPWHETNWKHAGGADSFFQRKWKLVDKIRPPWECLHLGPSGTNWCGRASKYVGGELPQGAAAKVEMLRDFMTSRRASGDFSSEKF